MSKRRASSQHPSAKSTFSTALVGRSLLMLLFAAVVTAAAARQFDHIIVVMEENRSFDHLLGWSKQLKVNGLTGKESNPISTITANSPLVYVDQDSPYIAPADPDHTTYATTSKIYGMKQLLQANYTETMDGFVEWEYARGGRNDTKFHRVMSMFPPSRLPVINQLAEEFCVMDRFFASVPGCTWPNRQFAMAATAGGNTETFFWYNGTPGVLFPQKTIFDQLEDEGFSWANYYSDSPWELMMESIAHHPDHLLSMDRFYESAADGTLPNYAFINPRGGINVTTGEGSNDMHPDHDVALAEKFYREIYEAVRNSPKWNRTLLILTFDEHGGFYDHVAPPTVGIPKPDDHASFPDFYFNFDRLGLRIVTILISPWVEKGTVISAPPTAQKPTATSEYDLTSIMATVRKLYNMSSPALTKRDAWAATFEHAFTQLSAPRTDCPTELVPAPPPTVTKETMSLEADQPLSHLQRDMAAMLQQLTGDGHTEQELAPLANAGVASHPDALRTQGELGKWLAGRFNHHKSKTEQWKEMSGLPQGSLPYKTIVGPALSLDWVFADLTWNISGGSNCTHVTIATKKLREEFTQTPLCLRHNISAPGGSVVTTIPCYPTSSACYNRDPNQHWIQKGITIRPHSHEELCLTTNFNNNNDGTLYLLPCNGTVGQSWSYFGPAPGAHDDGFLFFGVGIGALGLVVN